MTRDGQVKIDTVFNTQKANAMSVNALIESHECFILKYYWDGYQNSFQCIWDLFKAYDVMLSIENLLDILIH